MRNIRFTQLVKSCGNPATALLWEQPSQNRSFMHAVKENRVLTILQRGGKADSGRIGFQESHHALYLLFPKPLPKQPEARVVGIRYDLIKEPEVKDPVKPGQRKAVKKRAEQSIEPALFKFDVQIQRTAVIHTTVRVSAVDKTDAQKLALKQIEHEDFKPDRVQNSIKAVATSA
jgi:hypothetical protein